MTKIIDSHGLLSDSGHKQHGEMFLDKDEAWTGPNQFQIFFDWDKYHLYELHLIWQMMPLKMEMRGPGLWDSVGWESVLNIPHGEPVAGAPTFYILETSTTRRRIRAVFTSPGGNETRGMFWKSSSVPGFSVAKMSSAGNYVTFSNNMNSNANGRVRIVGKRY